MCTEHDIKFIGASSDMISKMGDKASAKATMKKRVPTIQFRWNNTKSKSAKITAKKIGYPIVLKASSGGGGKGMRAVNNNFELEKAWESAKQESMAAFGMTACTWKNLLKSLGILRFKLLVIALVKPVICLKGIVQFKDDIKNKLKKPFSFYD